MRDLRENFSQHNQITLPEDLSVGDIIYVNLPIKKSKPPRLQRRACVIVGIGVNPTTMEVKSLHVARLAFYQKKPLFEHDTILFPEQTGLDKGVILRSNRVDEIPVNKIQYLGRHIQREGTVHQDLLKDINYRLYQGIHSAHAGKSRIEKPSSLKKTILIASLFAQKAEHPSFFSYLNEPFPPLSQKQLDLLQGNKGEQAAHREPTGEVIASL